MTLFCPTCGSMYTGEDTLDWYGDAVFGKFHCNDCGTTFAAKYVLEEVVNGSVRNDRRRPNMQLTSVGAQMVRHMMQTYERSLS